MNPSSSDAYAETNEVGGYAEGETFDGWDALLGGSLCLALF